MMIRKAMPAENCISAQNTQEWHTWLKYNHKQKQNIWLVIYHRDSPVKSITYEEAVDEALCFGWIDSKPNKRDGDSYYQLFSQRNARSNWSRINKQRVERLLKEDRIQEAGHLMIQTAKMNGSWDALNTVENLIEPDDLRTALDANPEARTFWDDFPRSVKRGILEWIFNAKKPGTRVKRIQETVEKAAQNIRANQYRKTAKK